MSEEKVEEEFGPVCMYNTKGESSIANSKEELAEIKKAGFDKEEPPKKKEAAKTSS